MWRKTESMEHSVSNLLVINLERKACEPLHHVEKHLHITSIDLVRVAYTWHKTQSIELSVRNELSIQS